MGRRPLSVVKNVLYRNCTATPDHVDSSLTSQHLSGLSSVDDNPTCSSWAPFDDGHTANQLLAYLDTAFLIAYAVIMFPSGYLAERIDLRYFITFGSAMSGLSLIAFGLAYPLALHSMAYFVIVQIISGAAQSTAWPILVTCISNWFDASNRGLVYGIWNSHTSIGNIVGVSLAGLYVERDWSLSFIVPGALMIVVGLMLFLFLAPSPKHVGLAPSIVQPLGQEDSINLDTPQQTQMKSVVTISEAADPSAISAAPTKPATKKQSHTKAISLWNALTIPGVVEYSLCLFFSKLVAYTFLYWLPRYITTSTTFSTEDSAYLSTPFDIGGILGAILAGYLSDKFRVNGIICNAMLILAIPSMFFYQSYGACSSWHNIILQFITGLLVNGPYCLITTAVSADLGNRITDQNSMATVSAIIDGMGSVGAVVGPLFTGFVDPNDWSAVFLMLMMSSLFASICLIRVTVQDVRQIISR